MNNKEVIENSLMVLEGVDFEELPEEVQELFIQAHSLLMHIETILEDN